jgi:hypothetical protein
MGLMAEEPKPQPDVDEQTRSLRDDEDDLSSVHDDPEAPEADALDQHRTTGPLPVDGDRVSDDPEVPEADAAEQRRAIVDDDETRSE